MRAELFQADGQTDRHMTKLIDAFRNFANSPKNPSAFCSGVAITALLRHRPRERRGVGLRMRMRTKLEHLLFRSIWETYFCVRFDSRNGRLKLLQSFWYTLYLFCFISSCCLYGQSAINATILHADCSNIITGSFRQVALAAVTYLRPMIPLALRHAWDISLSTVGLALLFASVTTVSWAGSRTAAAVSLRYGTKSQSSCPGN